MGHFIVLFLQLLFEVFSIGLLRHVVDACNCAAA